MNQLEDVFRFQKVFEPVLPHVPKGRPLFERGFDQRSRALGQQHLAAVRGTRDSRSAVNIQANVVRPAEGAGAGVKTHPDADGAALRPRVLRQGALRIHRGGDGVTSRLEHDEEGVALGAELRARVRRESLAKQLLLVLEHGSEPFAKMLDQPGAPLDIAE
jgi:hypothetical protein